MFKTLYGNLKYSRKSDLIFLPIKYLYLLYTVPFLVFAFMLSVRSVGVFGNPTTEEMGIVKAILLHMSAVVISFAIWGTLWSIFLK